ncbi:MAG: hypothetical protein D8M58_18270 [Calditrichaeota bacterium]|nr:MAG: hypothetical protein DWQ03_11500 [Calditrichota bacterium]MBL1207356.1 hypothetical protein [Calditrichota bacterium]NOG47188.1 hypothetical protein [Calditrichota bacterium]
MKSSLNRFQYLFQSTKGLTLVAISMVALVTAIWGTLSGPMVEWGVRDFVVDLLGMELHHWEREGRIIMLYHAIAMAILAIEVYFITSIVPMKKHQQVNINALATVGYLVAMIFGLWFAYFGHEYIFHGLFLVGQTLVFFSGVSLAAALWPWNKEYYLAANSDYAHTKSGLDLERTALFTMTVLTLISATWGAVAGSYWSNGHETFLAENLIRNPYKTGLEKAIIGHLHIMLSLVAVAITLIVGRWVDFKGILHKWSMYLMIFGSITLTFGALAVVWIPWAHTIIYFGSVGVMLAALLYVIYSWKKIIHERVTELGLEKPTFWQKFKAMLHDPLKFGSGWQMVFMNFTVSGIGIFMAIKLDKIFRVWPAREERITLTGHWHILAAIIATIIIMYYWDISGMKGKTRQWAGWTLIIASDIAFASATVFSMKRLFVTEYFEGPVVNWTMVLMDFGLGAILVMMAVFLGWRLFGLFKQEGLWKAEAANPELDVNRIHPAVPVEGVNVEEEIK